VRVMRTLGWVGERMDAQDTEDSTQLELVAKGQPSQLTVLYTLRQECCFDVRVMRTLGWVGERMDAQDTEDSTQLELVAKGQPSQLTVLYIVTLKPWDATVAAAAAIVVAVATMANAVERVMS
jgi:hypothetical protein